MKTIAETLILAASGGNIGHPDRKRDFLTFEGNEWTERFSIGIKSVIGSCAGRIAIITGESAHMTESGRIFQSAHFPFVELMHKNPVLDARVDLEKAVKILTDTMRPYLSSYEVIVVFGRELLIEFLVHSFCFAPFRWDLVFEDENPKCLLRQGQAYVVKLRKGTVKKYPSNSMFGVNASEQSKPAVTV